MAQSDTVIVYDRTGKPETVSKANRLDMITHLGYTDVAPDTIAKLEPKPVTPAKPDAPVAA